MVADQDEHAMLCSPKNLKLRSEITQFYRRIDTERICRFKIGLNKKKESDEETFLGSFF